MSFDKRHLSQEQDKGTPSCSVIQHCSEGASQCNRTRRRINGVWKLEAKFYLKNAILVNSYLLVNLWNISEKIQETGALTASGENYVDGA